MKYLKYILLFVLIFLSGVSAAYVMTEEEAKKIIQTDNNYEKYLPWKHQLAWKTLVDNDEFYKYVLSYHIGKFPSWYYRLADEYVNGNPRNGKRHR